LSNFASPWEVNQDGGDLRNLLPAWSGISLIPAGWLYDGRLAIFGGEGTFWGRSEVWPRIQRSGRALERLVDDAPEFDSSIRVRSRGSFCAVGVDRLGELQHYDQASGTWAPLFDGISAEAVEYSPDGQRVAYVTYPQRTLWVRQADGRRPIQLTSQPMLAAFPRWSPDGKRIAFSAGEGDDKPMRLYLIDSDGGQLSPAAPSAPGSQGYPTWSPDGKRLLYGIINTSLREAVYIRLADLETGKVTKLEGSDGLFAPRWSPDGATVAALRFMEPHTLMLLHLNEHRWEAAPGLRVDWPAWMPDSRSILCDAGDLVMTYKIATGKFETLTSLKPEELGGYTRWIGTAADGSPLRILNRDSRQIYALQVEQR